MTDRAPYEASDRARFAAIALSTATLLAHLKAAIQAHADRAGISPKEAETLLMKGIRP